MKRIYKQQSKHRWRPYLIILILLGACGVCIASENGVPTDNPPAPDILDGSSSSSTASSSSGSNNGQLMTCTSNINALGMLPLAPAWSEKGPVTVGKQPLAQGSCVAYEITPEQMADTACGVESPDNYILVEFWQLSNTTGSSSSNSSTNSTAALTVAPDGPELSDVRILAARGTQPWLSIGSDGHTKVTPPIRDADTGLTPVGTFQDDAAMVYSRSTARVFFPTNSPMTDVGEPLQPDTWYITIAVLPQETSTDPLPGYAIRASCIQANKPVTDKPAAATSKAAAAAEDTTQGVPCPVAIPGGPQCSGRGVCTLDPQPQVIENSRYCDCQPGFGSYACQQELTSLPINSPQPTVVTVGPGEWGYWEVTLPGLVSVPGGPARDAVAAAAAGLGRSLVGNEELLVTAERLDAQEGYGGNPLVFLKPFMTKDHNQPMLDALDNDVVSYSDLRSFQLQLNKHYFLQRDRVGPVGGSSYAMPRRWYVAIYNSNATRLSQPVKVALSVQYRDLNRQPLVCPYNCNDNGRCVDPKMTSSLMPLALGTSDASIVTAVGPMQDRSPVDAGFMCVCNEGFAGLTCEGRMANVTVGSGEQKLGPEVLQPGEWFFYIVTVDQGFNPQTQDLGIAWQIGDPGMPPSNYSSAYISFDQGPLPSRSLGDRRLVIPVRKSMTSYSKLIVRDNPPLPLQVPGSQLSPGGTYVVSIFNSDYVVNEPFKFYLAFFVMSESGTFLHPYMSILLGVTAAVILCLAMTLCKRVVIRYGLLPWRWGQRRRELEAAANGQPGQGDSLSLDLMASQQSNRGVPPEIYRAFPCRPYALKDYQQRQHDVQQQQQQSSDVAAGPDPQPQHHRRHQLQSQHSGVPTSPVSTISMVSSGVGRASVGGSDIEQQQQQGSRVVEMAAGSGRQPFHARLSQLSQTLSGHLSMQLSGTVPAPAVAAAAAGDGMTAGVTAGVPAGVTSGPRPPQAGKAGTASGEESDVAAVRDDEAPSCTVCLGEYVPEEMVRQLPCGHEFHQVCIDQWMANHGTCPICRAPLWPGAYEPEDEDSENGSGSVSRTPRQSASATPANIYVHHEMPAGGFMGGTAIGAVASNMSSTSRSAAAAADASDGAAAGAGAGDVGSPTGTNRVFVPVGVNEQQPQRLLWQEQHQQQQWHPLQPMSQPAPTGTAVYTGEQAQHHQHRQQHQRQHQRRQRAAATQNDALATASDWIIPAVQAEPATWHRQQLPARPRHST